MSKTQRDMITKRIKRLQREIENLNDEAIDGTVPSWYAYNRIGDMERELDELLGKIDE